MSHNWGPHYIVPSGVIKSYSGNVMLREKLDEDLLNKELKELGLSGSVAQITNPWYYRKKEASTWIKIGESNNIHENFPTRWDTSSLADGQYEVMGLMHVFVKKGDDEVAIARQNIVEVTVAN
jgi:hypothetical protein